MWDPRGRKSWKNLLAELAESSSNKRNSKKGRKEGPCMGHREMEKAGWEGKDDMSSGRGKLVMNGKDPTFCNRKQEDKKRESAVRKIEFDIKFWRVFNGSHVD